MSLQWFSTLFDRRNGFHWFFKGIAMVRAGFTGIFHWFWDDLHWLCIDCSMVCNGLHCFFDGVAVVLIKCSHGLQLFWISNILQLFSLLFQWFCNGYHWLFNGLQWFSLISPSFALDFFPLRWFHNGFHRFFNMRGKRSMDFTNANALTNTTWGPRHDVHP